MYKAIVNDSETYQVNLTPEGPVLNDQPFTWDIVRLSDRHYHIIHNNTSYAAELITINAAEKSITLKINQHLHEVKVKDRFAQLLEQMGMSHLSASKINDIKAPMPGLIVGVTVEPGDTVKKGDSVLVLEAMKMENLIKSPGEGSIKSIRVAKGDRVEKNQVLVEFA